MNHIGINTPCPEKWEGMRPTQQGAFCLKCDKEVLDFTDKSSLEIKQLLAENMSGNICGRGTNKQFEDLNNDFVVWQSSSQQTMKRAMLFSLIVVFGMTLFSCSTSSDREAVNNIQTSFQKNIEKPAQDKQGAIDKFNEIITNPILEEIQKVGEQALETPLPVLNWDFASTTYLVQDSYTTGGVIMMTDHYIDHLTDFVQLAEPLTIEDDQFLIKEVEPQKELAQVLTPPEFDINIFPNPVPEIANVSINFPIDQKSVKVELYSLSGTLIQSVSQNNLSKGEEVIQLNMFDLEPAVYLVRVVSEDFSITKRVVKQ